MRFLFVITFTFLRGLLSTDVVSRNRHILTFSFSFGFFIVLMLSTDLLFGLPARGSFITMLQLIDNIYWGTFRINVSFSVRPFVLISVTLRIKLYFYVGISCSNR